MRWINIRWWKVSGLLWTMLPYIRLKQLVKLLNNVDTTICTYLRILLSWILLNSSDPFWRVLLKENLSSTKTLFLSISRKVPKIFLFHLLKVFLVNLWDGLRIVYISNPFNSNKLYATFLFYILRLRHNFFWKCDTLFFKDATYFFFIVDPIICLIDQPTFIATFYDNCFP